MNINLNFSAWKDKKTYSDFFRKVGGFCVDKMTWIFLGALILATGYLLYLWYFFILSPGWSELKKQEYRNNNGREVVLNENLYQQVEEKFSKRKENYSQTPSVSKDIFHLN